MKPMVYILHAVEWVGIPFLSSPLRLDVAYGYVPDQPSDLDLDVIFRQNNAVEGNERNCQAQARSLSVGDVVVIDGVHHVEAYMVDIAGFKSVEPAVLPWLLGWLSRLA